MLFFECLPFVFCVLIHGAQLSQRFVILRKQPAQKRNGDGSGNELFRREGNPQKGQIAGGDGGEPWDAKQGAQPKRHIGPAVGDESRNAKAQYEARVQKQPDGFLAKFFDLLPHLFRHGSKQPRLYILCRGRFIIV